MLGNNKKLFNRRWKLGLLAIVHIDFGFIYASVSGLTIQWFNVYVAAVVGVCLFIGGYLTATDIWGVIKKSNEK